MISSRRTRTIRTEQHGTAGARDMVRRNFRSKEVRVHATSFRAYKALYSSQDR